MKVSVEEASLAVNTFFSAESIEEKHETFMRCIVPILKPQINLILDDWECHQMTFESIGGYITFDLAHNIVSSMFGDIQGEDHIRKLLIQKLIDYE